MENEIGKAQALYRLRTSVGWNAAKVSSLLDVSARTVGLWETAVQPMPEARWRLFVHEVAHEFTRRPELVVVFANDGLTPVDAVSDANFVNLRVDNAKGVGVITSLAVDRVSNEPKMHSQCFSVGRNEHVVNAATKWKANMFAGAVLPDDSLLAMHRWLTRRVLEAELHNPNLSALKDKITAANQEVERAKNESEEIRTRKARELDAAVKALLHEVQKSKHANR